MSSSPSRTSLLLQTLRSGRELSVRDELELVVRLAVPAALAQVSYILMQYMKSSQLSMEAIRVGAGREQRANAQMVKMAITVITIAPIMCVYPLLQKYFVKGIMIGAIKG